MRSKHRRVAGRAVPYNKEKMRKVLAQFGIAMSDEDVAPYKPWEEQLLGAVNGMLSVHLASEDEAVLQTLGQYKLFVYSLEQELPRIIKDNPDASGTLLLAIAAHQYTTKLMLMMQQAAKEEEPLPDDGHRMA